MNARAQFIAFQAILVKEILRFARIWIQTMLPPMMTTALYFVIFGRLIGSQIGPVRGYGYMDYIVPGLILMAVITQSYANVVSSFYGSKFLRNVEEMLVAPVPNYVILLGFIAGGLARGLAVGAAVTLVAFVFSHIQIHSLLVTLSVVALTSVLFSLGGFINAMYAKSFDDIALVPTFVLTPLTYLGGVFYSVDMLPGFWQHVSLANPIFYMVNAFRYGMLGVTDTHLLVSYLIILGFIAVLFGFSIYLLNRGVGIRS